MRVLHDRVIVQRLNPEGKSPGGIMLPGEEKPEWGTVIFVGPGKRETMAHSSEVIPLTVRTGDKVLFGKYSGQTFKLPGSSVELLAMREEDIIGIID